MDPRSGMPLETRMDLDPTIISLRFNQDNGLFACSTNRGMRIYNVQPLQIIRDINYKRDMGSMQICELVYRWNYMALVGGGKRQKYPGSHVIIFDIHDYAIAPRLKLYAPVVDVRATLDRIAIAEKEFIHFLTFPDCEEVLKIPVKKNKRGILALKSVSAKSGEKHICVYSGNDTGVISILDIFDGAATHSINPLSIQCHNNELACIALNKEGSKLATASTQGTVIKIWDTSNGEKLLELRRGVDPATIYSLDFNLNSQFVCCSSNKGTVHIFAIDDSKLNRPGFMSSLVGNLGGLKSFASFQVPPESRYICAFNPDDSIVALGFDGRFYKFSFTLDGTCAVIECEDYLHLPRL